jgi:hypothetical protein
MRTKETEANQFALGAALDWPTWNWWLSVPSQTNQISINWGRTKIGIQAGVSEWLNTRKRQ